MEREFSAVPAARDSRLTVGELGRRVGMSARNIRAYQARRLLPPPVRSGRTVYYHDGHVRRLEAIQELQRQGYNLVAIATILGVRDRAPDELAGQLDPLLAQQPLLIHALSRHGVVVRGDDGRVRAMRPRVLQAALALRQAGLQPTPSLQLLSETLDRVMLMADELIHSVGAHLLTAMPISGGALDDAALTEKLAAMLTEAFRVAVENSGQAWVPDQATPHASDGEVTPRADADFG